MEKLDQDEKEPLYTEIEEALAIEDIHAFAMSFWTCTRMINLNYLRS